MRANEQCAECLWRRQTAITDDPECLSEIRKIIDERKENDCSPYLIYLFNEVHKKYTGKRPSYSEVKKSHNDMMLSMEDSFRKRIEESVDPLKTSFLYARIGNYIDLGALRHIDKETFLSQFDSAFLSENELAVFRSFLLKCQNGKSFLLLADNCGEIVLDKLFLEQLKKSYPQLEITVMVRGGEVLNDATAEDAAYVGLDGIARIVSNGKPISGTVYRALSDEAKTVLDTSDVIFAKGQGNYESLSGQGLNVFYSFLCKCDMFTSIFNVPKLTGIFLEEN